MSDTTKNFLWGLAAAAVFFASLLFVIYFFKEIVS